MNKSDMCVWLASMSFIYRNKDGQLRESGHQIHFKGHPDANIAAIDCFRWAVNRREALPDIFGPLGCVKLYRFEPTIIEPNGYWRGSTGGCWYEWKMDTGRILWPLEVIRPEGYHDIPTRDI